MFYTLTLSRITGSYPLLKCHGPRNPLRAYLTSSHPHPIAYLPSLPLPHLSLVRLAFKNPSHPATPLTPHGPIFRSALFRSLSLLRLPHILHSEFGSKSHSLPRTLALHSYVLTNIFAHCFSPFGSAVHFRDIIVSICSRNHLASYHTSLFVHMTSPLSTFSMSSGPFVWTFG